MIRVIFKVKKMRKKLWTFKRRYIDKSVLNFEMSNVDTLARHMEAISQCKNYWEGIHSELCIAI